MSFTPMAQTLPRDTVQDFTFPFHQEYTAILYRKSKPKTKVDIYVAVFRATVGYLPFLYWREQQSSQNQ